MTTQAETRLTTNETVVRQSVVSYVVQSDATVPNPPAATPAGTYIARLSNGGVGNPSFVVLPYSDDEPAELIVISGPDGVTGRSARYARIASSSGTVDYQIRMPPTFLGWVSRD